jgi:EF hand
MKMRVRVLTISAIILACGAMTASAQQTPGSPKVQQPTQQQSQPQSPNQGPGMMGQGGMMGRGMMGQGGMMGRGMMGQEAMMGHAMMMRMIFILMDSDGDGTISLQEFQTAHERMFKGMDANKDGRLTLEEMQAFMHGTRSVPQQ